MIAKILAVILLLCGLSACGGDRGWRLEFGVAPVSAINDNQSLTVQNDKGKY